MEDTVRIRILNDVFRKTFIGGRAHVTPGVAALDDATKERLLNNVREFTDFTEDNDSHEEHDFGAIDIDGIRFFWKIDYYDETLTYGSTNPADPRTTTRVMTIMLASEY